MVDLDYGGGHCQGAGGYALDRPLRDSEGKFVGRVGTAYGMEWIIGLMRAVGVEDFSEVVGRTVLAIRDEGVGPVLGLEPLPTEPGEPFMFADLAAEHNERGERGA